MLLGFPIWASFSAATPFMLDEKTYEYKQSPLGTSRILVVCLPNPITVKSKLSDPLYASIDWKGFEERDLVIVEIREETAYIIAAHKKGSEVPRFITTYSDRFRAGAMKDGVGHIAECKNKLEYVLIGKDQTQKKRWNLFPSNEDLYSLIDAMPMRRFEMRQRKENN